MEIYNSHEGLILTSSYKADRLEQSKIDFNSRNHLMMADMDFKAHEMIKSIIKIIQKSNNQLCQLQKAYIESFKMKNNFNPIFGLII